MFIEFRCPDEFHNYKTRWLSYERLKRDWNLNWIKNFQPQFSEQMVGFFSEKNCESRLCLFFSQKKLSIYFEKRTAAVTLYFEGKHITVVQRVIKSSNLFIVEYLCKLDSFLFLLHTDPFNYWMYENSINNILKIISEITLKFLTLNQWAQKVTTGGFHWQLFATLLVNGEITFVE